VVPTAGSTALLGIIARTLLAPGLNAITSERSFIVYPIATQAAGGKLILTPLKHDGYDLDAVVTAIDRHTRIIYLSNPNNPTGTMVSAAEVDRFIEKVPDHVVVILDEAYSDFAQYFADERGLEYSHGLDYIRQGRKVVVLRTFSKAYGLAGVRVGYGIGPPELMTYFGKMRTTFSVSTVAQFAALAALEDEAHTRMAIVNNAEQAVVLAKGIAEIGYRVVPTWTNFLYCEAHDHAPQITERLQEEGVIVRPLAAWGAPKAMRVTVGTPEQNRFFLKAFRKVTEKVAAR
jgi:histidinol-phosphate aminotransferase